MSDKKTFLLPDLGEGLPDATIVEWYVKVGDVVRLDDNLVSMETAKAVVDVPSPVSGKIELPPKTTLADTDSVQVTFSPEDKSTGGTVADVGCGYGATADVFELGVDLDTVYRPPVLR